MSPPGSRRGPATGPRLQDRFDTTGTAESTARERHGVGCAHRCALHEPADALFWLGSGPSGAPPRWRFVWHVMTGMPDTPPRDEQLEACAVFADRYGDAELAAALHLGLSLPPTRDMSVFADVLAALTRQGVR